MAFDAFGTLLKRNGATIAEVRDISGPNFSRGTIETTNHDSASGWKEFILGTKENGEVSFAINFDPDDATHSYSAGLLKDFVDGTLQAFTITFTDATDTVWSFNAYVTAFGVTAPVEGVLGASLTLKISGAPTLA